MARVGTAWMRNCPDGYYWDAERKRCRRRAEDPGTCPQGFKWSAEKNRCVPRHVGSAGGTATTSPTNPNDSDTYQPAPDVPDIVSCPQGSHWDDVYGKCVQDRPENCPEHMQWDVGLNRCVPLTAEDTCPPGMEWDPLARICVTTPEEEEPDKPDKKKDEENESALALIQNTLRNFGLEGLSGWAWEQILKGRPVDRILIDLRDQPLYQERFAGNFARYENGYGWLPEATYLSYVSEVRRLGEQRFGVYVSDDLAGNLIARNVSVAEFDQRLRDFNTFQRHGPAARFVFDNIVGRHLTDQELLRMLSESGDEELQRMYDTALYSALATQVGLSFRPAWEGERLRQAGINPLEGLEIYKKIIGALPGVERLNALDRAIDGDEATPFNSFESLFGAMSGLEPTQQEELARLWAREAARMAQGGGLAFSGTAAIGGLTSAQRRQA